MPFVYIHGAWLAAWIALNVGAAGASLVQDTLRPKDAARARNLSQSAPGNEGVPV